ncbi:MAG TPA: hypothetical protein VLJ83_09735 [Gemmatimonadaceae bacterium]|nr:hypothetical protein [Gemmatimonadaceae bacterium]
MRNSIVVATTLLLCASTAGAQGALSLQGLGYPSGGLSARAEGTGGGLGDFDALSLTSPASIAGVGAASLFFQYSPEFRKVTTSSGSSNTTTARFPLVAGVLPMGQSWTLGFSSSTFLDRSTETSLSRLETVGESTDTVTLVERNRVLGAINDIRLALAWSNSPKFRIGFGGHIFSGSNRITLSDLFPDSSKYISTSETSNLSYAGFAASVGVEVHPSRVLGFSIAARKGGDLRAESGDTTVGTARLPDHYSASVMFEGIPGAAISARAAHDSWSSLSSLSTSGIQAFDGWDIGAGIEASGPRLMQRIVTLRAGVRSRTLPFGFNGEKVQENTVAAGLGFPLTRDRASFEFAAQRASRKAADVSERGYILSFGLRVSP